MDRASALWPEKWAVWDADPHEPTLRVALHRAGGGGIVSDPVEEVEVRETGRDVIVTLYARRSPSKLASYTIAIEIPLRAPVGRRRVFDGVDGQRRFEDDGDCRQALRDAQPWTKPLRCH